MSVLGPNPHMPHLPGLARQDRDGAGAGPGGELAPGLGGGQSRDGGAQDRKGLSSRAARFGAIMQGSRAEGAGAAKPAQAMSMDAGKMAPVIVPPQLRKGPDEFTGQEAGSLPVVPLGAVVAQAVPVAPQAEPAPLLPAGTAQAQTVADILHRIAMEVRAASGRGGGLAEGGKINLAFDLGRTVLGVSGLKLEVTAQTLTLVLTVSAGGAAHDLPQAVQALAQGLAARHPHRTIRIDTDAGPANENADTPEGAAFDPFRPWGART